MNNVIELKGKKFGQSSKRSGGGGVSMNGHMSINHSHVNSLQKKMETIVTFWDNESRPFSGVLISVHYNKIVAKSNRIGGLFKGNKSNFAIVGAKFNDNKNRHIITYFLDATDLSKSIHLLSEAGHVLINEFNGDITQKEFNDEQRINEILFDKYNIAKTTFKQIIADVSYIDTFEIEKTSQSYTDSIITLYDTKMDTKQLLEAFGITIMQTRILDGNTIYLDERDVKILIDKAPYLISQATENLLDLSPDDFVETVQRTPMSVPIPYAEPTVGVIDTLFDTRVYFSDWVEYHDTVSKDITKGALDYEHGTAVTSLIVDGPQLNPWLDDGCGRFRVRHFGVATKSGNSSFTIMKRISKIVISNPDIKVWNISLGSNGEINDNFISAEAAMLDKIQFEHDVIFVVAGTNKASGNIEKIGSPADSINSIVVNSVTKSNGVPEYARKGLALSFFAKPDVSYYGGSSEEYIRVCKPLGEELVAGTSFAAPWIARKLSYMIDILGLRREVAKAFIIDAARNWELKPTPEQIAVFGHGVVPIHINDIVQTSNDEIRFLVSDVSEAWNTYNYEFPVPLEADEKYAYYARATMCYFPKCDRTQGVDYTNTELNLHFGRIQNNKKIKDIIGDTQNEDGLPKMNYLYEDAARTIFRKWDNVKYVAETIKEKTTPRKSYQNKNWGMEIKTADRLHKDDGVGVRFGVVITLKHMKGKNKIDEFIRNCALNGWIVVPLDVQTKIDINQKVQEEIVFE